MPRSESDDNLRQMPVNRQIFEVRGNLYVQSCTASNPLHHYPIIMTTTKLLLKIVVVTLQL